MSRAGYERSTGRICARHGRGVNAAQIPAAAHALAVAHGWGRSLIQRNYNEQS